jgi:RNA 3'-terminal phosphate cyclase (ATP)
MGGRVELTLQRWGWYPKGGGQVDASISPSTQLQSVDLSQRGDLKGHFLLSAISNLPAHIGERQKDEALRCLNARGYEVQRVEAVDGPSPGTGTAVFLGAKFGNGVGGFTSLGKKGKPAEKVAREACFDFFSYVDSDAAVDRHLADQLLFYMALAKGRSSLCTAAITSHLLTNIWVIEQFLPVRFQVDEGWGVVSVEGVGFTIDGP